MDSRYYANILIHIMNDGTVFLLPTVLPLVTIEYGFTYSIAGFVSAIIPFCLGVFQTPLGRFSDSLPHTTLLRGGILIVSAGSFIVGLVPALFIPGLFLIGLGGSFYHPVGYAYTSRILKNSNSGAALGLQSSSGDCGVLAAFLSAGAIAALAGWRGVFITWAVLCFASFVISSFFLKDEGLDAEKPHRSSDLSLLKKKEAVLIMILFAILGAISRILGTFLPTIFFKMGNNLNIADPLSAIFIGTGIVGGIIGGRLVDKHEGRSITLLFFASATVVLTAMSFVSQIPTAAFLIAAAGLLVTGLYPIFYFMMRLVTSASIVGVSYGLLLSIGMLSGMISLPIGGYIIDISPEMLFLFAALLAFVGVVFSLKLPKLSSKR